MIDVRLMKQPVGRGQADIAAIALEDDGIYAWLGELNGDNQVIAQKRAPCTLWKDIGYSVGAVRKVISDYLSQRECRSISAVGFSSFGQIDRAGNALIGVPREEWANEKKKKGNFPVYFGDIVEEVLGRDVRVVVEHDVTASALAEWQWGTHAKRVETNNDIFGYIRLGCGLGAEVLLNGNLLHKDRRMEAGHMPIVRNHADKLEKSTCDAHELCAEGRASKLAIDRRSQSEATESKILGDYLGQMIASLTMFLMCDIVVVGGKTLLDVHASPKKLLYDEIRSGFRKWLVKFPSYGRDLDVEKYIVPASFRTEDAAITGLVDLVLKETGKDRFVEKQ